jgi:hypothetical protein
MRQVVGRVVKFVFAGALVVAVAAPAAAFQCPSLVKKINDEAGHEAPQPRLAPADSPARDGRQPHGARPSRESPLYLPSLCSIAGGS